MLKKFSDERKMAEGSHSPGLKYVVGSEKEQMQSRQKENVVIAQWITKKITPS